MVNLTTCLSLICVGAGALERKSCQCPRPRSPARLAIPAGMLTPRRPAKFKHGPALGPNGNRARCSVGPRGAAALASLNIRPVPKPLRVGIDCRCNHSIYVPRCGKLIGRGIGAYAPVFHSAALSRYLVFGGCFFGVAADAPAFGGGCGVGAARSRSVKAVRIASTCLWMSARARS